jgi:tRNA nucleotidyltransferase/poly(A) polymerase
VWYRYSQEIQKLLISLPQYVNGILNDITQSGGRALIVGGAVRDAILGKSPKDIDFEVYGLSYDQLNNILSKYGKSDLVGQSFGVIKFVGEDGSDFDFSLPRTDSKAGVGHKDFTVSVNSDLTPEQAASRRDFTINAISYNPLTGEIIDPYNGRQDLQNKVLRHTSDAFAEDPLRVLRGMQFASRFGFDIAPETAELANSIREEYKHLPKERIYEEFKKLVTKGIEPGKALDFLYTTGWSENFPEIHNLKDTPQEPEYHPEGWSVRVVPPDSFTAGVAVAKPINLLSRDVLLGSQTNPASGESRDITANTQFSVKSGTFFRNLTPTNTARVGNLIFSPLVFPPTLVAPSKSFVREIRISAQQANKIIGVMFQVPVSSVLRIMSSSIDNDQIIQGIIKSVSIYVMNMFASEQDSSQMDFHNVSVEKNTPRSFSRNGNLSISPTVIDPKFSIVDNNVVFYFYLSGVGDIDIHNNGIADNHIYLLVELGDVSTHTAHVMNEAAQIADRENLSPQDREVLIYAALAHDFAKPDTTAIINKKGIDRITSHGHEEQGGPKAEAFLKSIGAPKNIIDKVVPLVQFHLSHIHHSNTPKQEAYVKSLAEKIHPANIRMLELLIEADHSGRPPLPKELPKEAREMSELAKQYNVYEGKHPDLLQGKDIMPYLDNKGGPIIGEILREHRNLILKHDPAMESRESALAWLDRRMKRQVGLIDGNDIMNVMGLTGPAIKPMLDEAWRAQRMGKFNTKEGALEWLKQQ